MCVGWGALKLCISISWYMSLVTSGCCLSCSYIHRNISMYFLTCEPNLKSNSDDSPDEADRFYADPDVWLKRRYDSGPRSSSASATEPLPTHIVMFDELYLRIPSWLRQHNFHFCDQFFHSHFPEGRSGGFVVAVCRLPFSLAQV